jgi:hypothetical protein
MNGIEQQIQDIRDHKYFRLNCKECNESYTGSQQRYNDEMSSPDSEWRCGHCGNRDSSSFDDDYWEEMQEKLELLEYILSLEKRISLLEAK